MKKKIFLIVSAFAFIFSTSSVNAEEPVDESLVNNIENRESEQVVANNSYTEDFKKFVDEVDEYLVGSENMSLISDGNTLKIESIFDGKDYETVFTYEDGILKYEFNDNLDNLTADTVIINTLFELYCSNNGYDVDVEWLLNQYDLTIEKNGIIYQANTLGNGDSDSVVVVDFELDIKNGLKTQSEVKEPTVSYKSVINPETGIYFASGALGVIALIGGTIYLISRKRSKFPQA